MNRHREVVKSISPDEYGQCHTSSWAPQVWTLWQHEATPAGKCLQLWCWFHLCTPNAVMLEPLPAVCLKKRIAHSVLFKIVYRLCAQESQDTFHLVSHKFSECCLWNSSNVGLTPKHHENGTICKQASTSPNTSLIMWLGFPGFPIMLLKLGCCESTPECTVRSERLKRAVVCSCRFSYT